MNQLGLSFSSPNFIQRLVQAETPTGPAMTSPNVQQAIANGAPMSQMTPIPASSPQVQWNANTGLSVYNPSTGWSPSTGSFQNAVSNVFGAPLMGQNVYTPQAPSNSQVLAHPLMGPNYGTPVNNYGSLPLAAKSAMAQFGVGAPNPPPSGYDSWWNYWNRPEVLSRLGAGSMGSISQGTNAQGGGSLMPQIADLKSAPLAETTTPTQGALRPSSLMDIYRQKTGTMNPGGGGQGFGMLSANRSLRSYLPT